MPVTGSELDSTARPHATALGGFEVGDRVVTLASVRPMQFASRSGHVAVLNFRDGEVGIDFSNETIVDNLRASTFFLPRELALKEAVETGHKAGESHVKACRA